MYIYISLLLKMPCGATLLPLDIARIDQELSQGVFVTYDFEIHGSVAAQVLCVKDGLDFCTSWLFCISIVGIRFGRFSIHHFETIFSSACYSASKAGPSS